VGFVLGKIESKRAFSNIIVQAAACLEGHYMNIKESHGTFVRHKLATWHGKILNGRM